MRAVLGFIAFVILIIFIVVIVARGGNNDQPETAPAPQLNSAASSSAAFNYNENGPIVAEEEHYAIRISINRMNRTINVIKGYNGTVVSSQSLSNTEAAFDQFLSALDRAGYTSERDTRYESEAGLCSEGRRYTFDSDQFDEDFSRWTTSCREKGNFGGDFTRVQSLFESQIPNYNEFISNARAATGLSL